MEFEASSKQNLSIRLVIFSLCSNRELSLGSFIISDRLGCKFLMIYSISL